MTRLLTALLLFVPATLLAQAPIVQNGDFATSDAKGAPAAWQLTGETPPKVVAEGNQRFLRCQLDKPSVSIAIQQVKLDPAWKTLTVSGKLRAINLKKGKEPFMTGRIEFVFADAAGGHVGGWPALNLDGDTAWKHLSQTVKVPKGAATLSLRCGMWACSGTVDFADVKVTPGEATDVQVRPVLDTTKPAGPHLADVFVQPSFRQKRLVLDVELANLKQNVDVEFAGELIDPATGKVEKTIGQKAMVGDQPTQVVRLVTDWPNPRLWDLGQPNLYTLKLTAKGAGLEGDAATFTTRFGFREFWIDGRNFMLNGHVVHFRPVNIGWGGGHSGVPPEHIRRYMDQGLNLAEVWPGDNDYRRMNAGLAKTSDELGFALAAAAPFIRDGESEPAWRARLNQQLKALRNHPSILLWASSGNRYINARDQEPTLLGKRDWSHFQEWRLKAQHGLDLLAVLKQFDPTRPTFTHAGGYVGDVYTLNNYLCLLPLQEREEWLSDWAKSGQMPLLMVEFGTPLFTSFLRGRDDYGHAIVTEPFSTEWAAVYFGPEAYRLESREYRQAIAAKFEKGQKYRMWRDEKAMRNDPAFVALHKLFLTNTWRAWRTWGISGGMVPWEDANGQLASLKPVNSDTLAWIAGPRNDFTGKDHTFAFGAPYEKSIVLINDSSKPLDYELTCDVLIDGQKLDHTSGKGGLQPGQIHFVPITGRMPQTVTAGRGELKLTATIGAARHEDSFTFRVLAPPAPLKVRGAVSVFDPQGETTALLAALGIEAKPLALAPDELPKDLVVIGRKALSGKGGGEALGQIPFDVPAFVKAGGRLLVFSQDSWWMEHSLGLRTARHATRRAFPIDAKHPILAGLEADDLRDWAGRSTLIPDARPTGGVEPWFTPPYGWHWGNRGVVAATSIEKPHRTSWRPILECEFDLAYSPLLEMEFGKGRVILCTLDLEDYVKQNPQAGDPAARVLAANLLRYAAEAPIAPKAEKVLYVGDDPGAKLLDFMGVIYQRAAEIDPKAELVLYGDNASDRHAEALLQAGGRILSLPRHRIPNEVPLERVAACSGSLHVPAWPETRGLSVSDLRWRSEHEAYVLAPRAEGEIGASGLLNRQAVGRGVLLHCQIDPTWLPADEKTYFRFTRWRQARALAQLLANMGATFKQDQRQLELLQRPAHAIFLSGTWDAQLTYSRPEPPQRKGNPDPGMTARAKELVALNAPTEGWKKLAVPAYMESYGPEFRWIDGEMVFRKTLTLPDYFAGKDLVFSVGRVDEDETTFFNGGQIGHTRQWLHARSHVIPGRLVKAGPNVLAVRAYDEMIHGGWCGNPEDIYLRLATEPTDFYHPDYLPARDDKAPDARKLADDPYRYFRW